MKRIVTTGVICLVIGLIIGVVGATKGFSSSEFLQVSEVIASNISDGEKAVYLESRSAAELGKWYVLENHSDLCSNKYTNELDSLRMSVEATLNGYNELAKQLDMDKYPEFQKKIDDYNAYSTALKSLIGHINKEEYDKAILDLDAIDLVDSKIYEELHAEIAAMGN